MTLRLLRNAVLIALLPSVLAWIASLWFGFGLNFPHVWFWATLGMVGYGYLTNKYSLYSERSTIRYHTKAFLLSYPVVIGVSLLSLIMEYNANDFIAVFMVPLFSVWLHEGLGLFAPSFIKQT